MFDRDYSEKRDFRRMSVNTHLHFNLANSNETFTGESRDISGSGISFCTSQQVQAGDILNVVIESELSKLPPLEICVEVIRVTSENENQYLIAAESKA
ncbi:MAG: pilus assembly protein PilZ [Gammaproteobacteria bacterium CG22_combo_CG10-13_8_21_14_all_40_8]|nr:MAG: pilus assembly protein PilZ [Gammaproteobacteria bacterium CG22_combo_CG10-13_8_21_14_all_40_8]